MIFNPSVVIGGTDAQEYLHDVAKPGLAPCSVEIEDERVWPDASDAVGEARSATIGMGAVREPQRESTGKPHLSLIQLRYDTIELINHQEIRSHGQQNAF